MAPDSGSGSLVWLALSAPPAVLAAWCAVGLLAALGWRWHAQLRALRQDLACRPAEASETTPHPNALGLIGHEAFQQTLEHAAQRCDRAGGSLAVLFVDVDDFGAINDSLGHHAGDAVLATLATRLQRLSGERLAATRLGGDEFVVLVEQDLAGAQTLARQVIAAFAEPVETESAGSLRLTASVGIAAYPLHGAGTRLTQHASTATRSVKRSGGNGFAVFDPRAGGDARHGAALVADLRRAVERDQLELVYQPKIDARTLRITAAEALLRWHHPRLGMISPTVFVPLAERHGLIGEIGNWVTEQACRQASRWRDAGLRMRVAINLSAYQMRQDDLVERLDQALRRHRLRPDRFTVEITESLALENTAATQHTFEGLRRLGLHVSIDDFGAGQTSLAYLRQLPASELKMDMSLVQDLAESADARAIAEAVIRLAHALDLRVVAEGIETEFQRDWLVKAGCDGLQGHLFAKPMSAEALGLWAMDARPADGDDGPGGCAFSPSLFQETALHPLD